MCLFPDGGWEGRLDHKHVVNMFCLLQYVLDSGQYKYQWCCNLCTFHFRLPSGVMLLESELFKELQSFMKIKLILYWSIEKKIFVKKILSLCHRKMCHLVIGLTQMWWRSITVWFWQRTLWRSWPLHTGPRAIVLGTVLATPARTRPVGWRKVGGSVLGSV